MNDERIDVTIPANVRFMYTLRGIFDLIVKGCPGVHLSRRACAEVQLVLQEACINAIRHGRGESARREVRVAFLMGVDRLIVEVRDHGPGFNPDLVPSPAPERLQEGGYGVFIMKESMDLVEVRRENGVFVLSLTKFYDNVPAGADLGAR